MIDKNRENTLKEKRMKELLDLIDDAANKNKSKEASKAISVLYELAYSYSERIK